MRAVGRIRHLWPLGLVGLGAVYVAWLGFGVETTGDYASWFAPAMNALLAGHLTDFFKLLPHDGAGGSILLRAPGALMLVERLRQLLLRDEPALQQDVTELLHESSAASLPKPSLYLGAFGAPLNNQVGHRS